MNAPWPVTDAALVDEIDAQYQRQAEANVADDAWTALIERTFARFDTRKQIADLGQRIAEHGHRIEAQAHGENA